MEVSISLIIAQMINFILLMLVLTFLYNKFMRPMMRKRADEIKGGFDQIEQQKKEIEKLKTDYYEQFRDMRNKAKEEIDAAIKDGNLRRDEIVNKAVREATVTLERARKEIDAEKYKALKEIHNEVTALSMKIARQLLRKEIDEGSSQVLIDELLSGLKDENLR